MRALIACLPLLFGTPALAQSVSECDWRAGAAVIAEPWPDNTRTYSNGKVRLAVLDTIEPAAAAFHLLVLSPPYSEVGDRQCRVVSLDGALGFSGMDISKIESDYDPARGLMFTLPAGLYNPETGGSNWRQLSITLNQATGQIITTLGDLAR
ncbi:hypothetical protein [Aliiroseovarius pelagivivens]|nr:hypothetical protein [Aliiroseovarius pelagivivens]